MSSSTTADPDENEGEGDGTDARNPLLGVLVQVRRVLDPVLDPLVRTLLVIRGSFIAFVATIGVVFLVLSVLLSEFVLPGITNGVVSGMALVWGASAFLYALLGNLGLRLIGYS